MIHISILQLFLSSVPSFPHYSCFTFFLLSFSVSPKLLLPLLTVWLSVHSSWNFCLSLLAPFCSQALFSYCSSLCWPLTTIQPVCDEQSTITGQSKATINKHKDAAVSVRIKGFLREDFTLLSLSVSCAFLKKIPSMLFFFGMGSLNVINQE